MCALHKNNVKIKSRTNPAGHFLCLWSHSHVWCWTCVWGKLQGDNVTKSVIINTQLCSLSWCVNLTVGQQEVLLLNCPCESITLLFSLLCLIFFIFSLPPEHREQYHFIVLPVHDLILRCETSAAANQSTKRFLLSSSVFCLDLCILIGPPMWLGCRMTGLRCSWHHHCVSWVPSLCGGMRSGWAACQSAGHVACTGRSQCDAGVMEDNSLSEQTVWPRVREEDWKERV